MVALGHLFYRLHSVLQREYVYDSPRSRRHIYLFIYLHEYVEYFLESHDKDSVILSMGASLWMIPNTFELTIDYGSSERPII